MPYDATPCYSSYNINKFNIEISNTFLDCRIFWARVVSSENESLFTKYQKHSFYEIQYALQGKIGMRLNEDDFVEINESAFLIVPPDTSHQIIESDACGARFIMAFSPHFRNKALQQQACVLSQIQTFPETAHMRQLLSIILKKDYHDKPIRKESITALVECFLLEVMETVFSAAQEKQPSPSCSKAEQDVQRVLAFIHDYNGVGISVSDIATRFMISERQLFRIFTSVTGSGPNAAIAQEKLKKIEELILTTPLSFSEIAEICGFSDGYAMNKFFKRHNRVSLSEFRALAGKKRIHQKPFEK